MTTSGRTARPSPLRRVALVLVLGSFSIAALLGIATLLTGSSFGENQAKILLTTLATGLASLAVLACFSTLDTRFQPVGVLGALLALVPLGFALYLIWARWDDGASESLFEWFFVTITVAVTLAQVCLLLAAAGNVRRLRWLLWTTVGLAGLMAVVLTGMFRGWISGDEHWRWIGVLAILDVLGTILTIAMARFGGDREPRTSPSPSPAEPSGGQVVLPPALAERVAEAAATTGRTPQQVVQDAVTDYLDR